MNILTIDLEEWYTYILYKKGSPSYFEPILDRYLDAVLSLLDEQNVQATFFCLGVIAREHPSVIRKIVANGHEIGCHSDTHELLTSFTPQQFREDSAKAISSLEEVIGTKVKMYRAPAFSITSKNKWSLEILVELGVEVDSSIFPANRSYGGFPTMNIKKPALLQTASGLLKEFPMNYATIFGRKVMFTGGGYFRLLPYNYTKRLLTSSDYNMSYFHLRDFDVLQKKVINTRYFINYVGINTCFPKFKALLHDFDFISVGKAEREINWDSLETVSI